VLRDGLGRGGSLLRHSSNDAHVETRCFISMSSEEAFIASDGPPPNGGPVLRPRGNRGSHFGQLAAPRPSRTFETGLESAY